MKMLNRNFFFSLISYGTLVLAVQEARVKLVSKIANISKLQSLNRKIKKSEICINNGSLHKLYCTVPTVLVAKSYLC
jgi:hypothetical protein